MKKAILVSCFTSLILSASAKIELATPFSDGVVLQCGMRVPVWGKVTPVLGKSQRMVSVSFGGQEKAAVVDPFTGCWKVELDPMEASKENRTMTVDERTPGFFLDTVEDTVEVRDVLVGEVWMCAGQSNTDCPIWGGNPHYRDGQGSTILQMTVKPWVRLVKTPRVPALAPKLDVKAEWRPMTPDLLAVSAKGVQLPSAMGCLYALELANALDIPIGLIDSSWGGTVIDTWTPPSGYDGIGALADVAALPRLPKDDFNQSRSNGVYRGKDVYKAWHQQPSLLWNGMVAAYAPMACRGLIWYQGCSNHKEPQRYCDKMHALYNGWAKEFGNPDLKFYFVQLAPWGSADIAAIQMAQAKFEAEEKNAGMAVINDVGNLRDIHPNDKRTVAKRLALHALKRDYGFDWVCDNSPTVKGWRLDGDRVELSFNDAVGWYLYNPDWSVESGFELCGADGTWHRARIDNLAVRETKGYSSNGIINGANLIVSASGVTAPKKLRYLHSAPWFGSLYNTFALPLGAFAIDDLTAQK